MHDLLLKIIQEIKAFVIFRVGGEDCFQVRKIRLALWADLNSEVLLVVKELQK